MSESLEEFERPSVMIFASAAEDWVGPTGPGKAYFYAWPARRGSFRVRLRIPFFLYRAIRWAIRRRSS